MKYTKDTEGGFTLVEILVVILIIGVLAAIAIPMFLNQRKSAVDASLKSDVKQLHTLLTNWQVANPHSSVPNMAIREADTTVAYGSHNTANIPMKASPGNYIKVASFISPEGDRGYCISAWNHGASEHIDENTPLRFSNLKGVVGDGCTDI